MTELLNFESSSFSGNSETRPVIDFRGNVLPLLQIVDMDSIKCPETGLQCSGCAPLGSCAIAKPRPI